MALRDHERDGFERLFKALARSQAIELWIFDTNERARSVIGKAPDAAWLQQISEPDRMRVLDALLGSEERAEYSYRIRGTSGEAREFRDIAIRGSGPANHLRFGISLPRFQSSGTEAPDAVLRTVLDSTKQFIHDIRTPLATLLNTSESMLQPRAAERQEKIAEIVKNQVYRLKELLSEYSAANEAHQRRLAETNVPPPADTSDGKHTDR